MVEVKITYETLFDLLRREKGRNELQELDADFLSDVKTYLNDKKNSLTSGELTSRAEKEKIEIQIKNASKIIKELYEIREKKIMNLAANKVRTAGSLINTGMMLDNEKLLFNDLTRLLKKHKFDSLDFIFTGTDFKPDEPLASSSSSNKSVSSSTSGDYERHSNSSSSKPKVETSSNSSSGSGLVVKVKITSTLPKFMGLDQKIYGPYSEGDAVDLPKKIAELLLNKNRAKLL